MVRHRCINCRKIILHNKLFCNKECKDLYFEKINNIEIKKWTNEKNQDKHRIKLSNLLNEENLKDMVKQTERNIDKLKR
jgi:hypothetical protein